MEMTEDHSTEHLTMIVDGDYLFRALRDVLGHPPDKDERANPEQLKHYAAAMRPGGYFVAAHYFDYRQQRGNADPFYAALQHMGYRVTLTGSEARDTQQKPKGNIIAELEALRETGDDLLYVGGYSHGGSITAALNNLRLRSDGSPRNITVACYRLRTDFDNQDFRLLDIVDDVEACPPQIYAESADGSSCSKSYVSVDAQSPPGTEVNETAFSAAFRAALEPESEPQAQDRASDHSAPPPDPGGYLNADRSHPPEASAHRSTPVEESAPEPVTATEPSPTRTVHDAPPGELGGLLVLIDHENIDGALAELIDPRPLSRQTRPEWEKLFEFVQQRAEGAPFVIMSFLQDGEKEKGFAGYLRSIGFEAVLLQREPSARNPGRRRSVVDEAIRKSLVAARDRRVDIIVVSHDGDYYDDLEALHKAHPERRIGMIGFVELMNAAYLAEWIERIDLERDVHAFNYDLPNRSTPVTLTTADDYDPTTSLDAFDSPGAPQSDPLLSWDNPRIAAIAATPGQKA